MAATTVLIVEDDRIIAKAMEKQLRAMGYAVAAVAASGETGVALALALRPDVVLMDVSLGAGIDGVEAASRIRDAAAIPVVYLTAYSDPETLARARVTDPFGYVLKPYDERDLRVAIELAVHRSRAARALWENERWLAATLGSIGDAVIATDDAGRVRFTNAVAEELTGWARADAAGRDVGEVFRACDEQSREPVENPAHAALATRGVRTVPSGAALLARDGAARPVDASAAPIVGDGDRVIGAVVVFRDVTARRRLDEHLARARRTEAAGRLAGCVAHDFNNIMSVITSCAELLLADDASTDERREFLAEIRAAGLRAARLAEQLLAFSGRQVNAPVALDLNAVVASLESALRRLVGEGFELHTLLAPDCGRVRADPAQLSQVVLNLAAHARDALPGGGRLTLATRSVDLDAEGAQRLPGASPGAYATLTVSDAGTDVALDAPLRAFEPFSDAPPGRDASLALAAVYGILKQNGGHLALQSERLRATTLRVYLPRVDEPAVAPVVPLRVGARTPATVLLAEDEPVLRRVLRRALTKAGYTVLEAANGREALAVADAHAGAIDLVLTDVLLPVMGGRELVAALQSRRSQIGVLFMSGFVGDGDDRVAILPATFIQKPFTLEELERRVAEALAKG